MTDDFTPRLGDTNLCRLPKAVKDHLTKAAREVDLDRLPAIACAAPSSGTSNGPS